MSALKSKCVLGFLQICGHLLDLVCTLTVGRGEDYISYTALFMRLITDSEPFGNSDFETGTANT